jgi:hypothetical protein
MTDPQPAPAEHAGTESAAAELAPTAPAPAPPVAQEIAAIEATLRRDPRAYWRDAALQARHRDLIDAQRGATPAPAPVAANEKRLAALHALMRDRASPYWRGPDAERLQAEYRALVGDEALPERQSGALANRNIAELRRTLPEELVADWDRAGGFAENLGRAKTALEAIVRGVGNAGAGGADGAVTDGAEGSAGRGDGPVGGDLVAAFDGLPGAVQAALYRELAISAPNFARPATSAELAALAAKDWGRPLVAAWGSAAARRFGAVIERFRRVEDGLTEAAALAAFRRFWFTTSAREKIAVLWVLGR